MGRQRTKMPKWTSGQDGRPRIAIVSSAYPVRSETFVFREVHALRERGWDVKAVSLHTPPEAAEYVLGSAEPQSIGIYGRSLPATVLACASECIKHPAAALRTIATACGDALRGGDPWRAKLRIVPQALVSLGLASRLRSAGVQMLHCHFAHAPTTIGMYAAMQLNVPFSFVGHANDLYQRRVLLEAKLRRAAFVSCISKPHRDLYSQLVPRDDAAYPIVRCGVDPDQFQSACASDAASCDGTSLLTVCRLVEKKGIDTLIRALAALRADDPSWQLTIAGSGPDEARLRTLADELRCSNAISWTGPVDSDQVARLMNQADLFVLPCREDRNGDRDGIPVVLMEAMASGLPVISGDIASIRDLVHDGETGVLVAGDDAASVARAICQLRDNAGLREQLVLAARKHVMAEFSQKVNISRLEQALCRSLHWETTGHHRMPSIQPSENAAWLGA